MKPVHLIISAAMVILVAGCAASAHYVKAGASDEELQRTAAKCRMQAGMAPGAGAGGALNASSVKENCMRSEGWVRDPPCDPNWTLC
jgi:hypothetical protein